MSDANTCDHGHAHINKSWLSIPEDYGVTLSVVCEEIGHSVGLAHNRGESDSCMYDENYGARHLTGHDKYMINQHY